MPVISSLTMTTTNILVPPSSISMARRQRRRTQRPCRQQGRRSRSLSVHVVLLLSSLVLLLPPLVRVAADPTGVPIYSILPPTTPSEGPIDDTQCNIEELEQANDSQLYTILQELVLRTEFFQHFAVDLEQTCPLSDDKEDGGEGEEYECPSAKAAREAAGGSSSDFLGGGFGEEEPAEPACSIDTSGGGANDLFGGMGASSNSPTQSNALNELSQQGFQSPEQADSFQWKTQTDLIKSNKKKSAAKDSAAYDLKTRKQKNNNNGDEEESDSDDVDSEDCGSVNIDIDEDHNRRRGEQWLPDSFWMDLCQHVTAKGEKTKVVNLALNPERNTGYNGTHLWNAIYQENCIAISKINNNSNYNKDKDKDKDKKSLLPFQKGSNGSKEEPIQPKCFEERVLYRLLSGLHTSTTISIAKNYYMPSKRKGRTSWEANPQYFMERFQHHPEYIRNLHFSYVVLLRALKKATPFLYNYDIRTGNIVQDEAAVILLRRLLDSSILQSCSSVFGAFDETLMFRQQTASSSSSSATKSTVQKDLDTASQIEDSIALQQSFKGVFHNISSILDCVQCQQCKLHGKMAMLGYGTALKILFIKPSALVLERNEIVAFVNTLAKLSESIREVRELTHLYWMKEQEKQQEKVDEHNRLLSSGTSSDALSASGGGISNDMMPISKSGWDSWNSVDGAVGAIAALQRQGLITPAQESSLIMMAMENREPSLLILTKHYFSSPRDSQADLIKLRDMLQQKGLLDGSSGVGVSTTATKDPLDYPDAIVVGSGLAGLSAALNILDRGGYVVLLEKEHMLGGNSNKASSGINACCPNTTSTNAFATSAAVDTVSAADSLDVFQNDTIKSAGEAARLDLIQVLVSNSASAVEWLQSRVGVDLSLKSQLGGHSSKRTHRPNNGMAGAEIIFGMQKAVKKYVKTGHVRILVDTKVTQLLTESTESDSDTLSDKTVVGVEYENLKQPGAKHTLKAPFVIMATGGFASDRRPKESYLSQYRPELLQFPTTAGRFSTGDGIALATSSVDAATTSMDKVQIHPTGWVDPKDKNNPSKTLAAELMRGVGGILLNDKGQRFCNELGTRAYVTDKMLSQGSWKYYMTKTWDAGTEIPTFAMLLSSSAAEDAGKHVDLYVHKGLLQRLEGVQALADWMGQSVSTVTTALEKYRSDAETGKDEFGKDTFRGMFAKDLTTEVFYAGTVTPVLHYCMGGITIDTEGHVLDTERRVIPGFYAAGEVTGGVHGDNRLAGNSLLECTVFGSLVGRNLPLQERLPADSMKNPTASSTTTSTSESKTRVVSLEELGQHNTEEDCWVAIHGVVYDLTSFIDEHPAGPASIIELAGQDGTDAFVAVHNQNILEDFEEDRIGVLASS